MRNANNEIDESVLARCEGRCPSTSCAMATELASKVCDELVKQGKLKGSLKKLNADAVLKILSTEGIDRDWEGS